ncbi:hypothetical protein KIV66_gp89 [Mycobacterium phage MyraDee]|uniref:Uncharacterized protein n=1 Tax=Mycobacterium phage MyraDee TaxID=2024303 RepID=A0A222Z0B5_9CAUD|nr:hypothetical protein KIV66_gp89 [Mycobacterium phage MyraDee]ASR77196.1 hypothetical protein SEA_MYRADEE_89 [Mycobacterium phage MyraDee]
MSGYTFDHNVDGDLWEYQVIGLPSLDRAQLWYRAPGMERFEIGHGKDIPGGWSLQMVARTMRRFINGDIDHPEYLELLPGT